MKIIFVICLALVLPNVLLAQASTNFRTFMNQGVSRNYLVYKPANYSASTPVPVLLNFHGYSSNASQQLSYGNFQAIADTAGFLIVLPNGTLDAGGTTHFNVGWGGSTIDDVAFTSAMLDSVISEFSVDETRIYSTGMSNGGFMSYHLACNLSSRIAAIASVTGSMVPATAGNCNASHPTPIMEIHGTADGTVPYNGTPGISFSIPATLSHWITYNNCNVTPIVTQVPNINTTDGCTAEKYVYLNGDNCSEVVHFKIIGGGHTWPDAYFNIGVTNRDINASIEIWKFLSQFDINGKIACQPVGLSEKTASISVYPNPVRDIMQIPGMKNGVEFKIHSMDGRLIREGLIDNSSINVGNLEPNVYLLSIEENVLKFIKTND